MQANPYWPLSTVDKYENRECKNGDYGFQDPNICPNGSSYARIQDQDTNGHRGKVNMLPQLTFTNQ